MEMVVLGWYILTLTDSPFLVGAISAARMSLNIMALFAGAIADRVPRHRILATVEFIMAAFAVVMLALILSGRLETWHIFVLAVAMGLMGVFQMPSAQSLVADTLPPDRIGNGAALNTLGRTIAMLIGPLGGGILFHSFGARGAYTAICLVFLEWLGCPLYSVIGQRYASGAAICASHRDRGIEVRQRTAGALGHACVGLDHRVLRVDLSYDPDANICSGRIGRRFQGVGVIVVRLRYRSVCRVCGVGFDRKSTACRKVNDRLGGGLARQYFGFFHLPVLLPVYGDRNANGRGLRFNSSIHPFGVAGYRPA